MDVIDETVCRECCRWLEPSVSDWNPVLASVVLDRVEHLQDSAIVETLRQHATTVIPVSRTDPDAYLPTEDPPRDIVQVEEIQSIIPGPAPMGGKRVVKPEPVWMVGITTAPRKRPTINHCLAALERSGWDEAVVFADGMDAPAGGASFEPSKVTWVSRGSKVGGWSNFVLSAQELVHRDPDADAYMMLQDDAMLARFSAVRPYLERVIRSLGRCALLSLYCCELDTRPVHGWHRNPHDFQRGAQAFVFGGDAMRLFVSDPICRPWEIPWHNQSARPLEQRGVDGNVGRWAQQRGIPLWLPTPSLVWHLGVTSTLWPGAQMSGIWRAGDFLERHR